MEDAFAHVSFSACGAVRGPNTLSTFDISNFDNASPYQGPNRAYDRYLDKKYDAAWEAEFA